MRGGIVQNGRVKTVQVQCVGVAESLVTATLAAGSESRNASRDAKARKPRRDGESLSRSGNPVAKAGSDEYHVGAVREGWPNYAQTGYPGD